MSKSWRSPTYKTGEKKTQFEEEKQELEQEWS